jgi:hypothetical protein
MPARETGRGANRELSVKGATPVVEPKNESNEQYFKRRGEERLDQAKETELLVRQSWERQESQLDDLIQRFDSDVRALLASFAQQAPEITEHRLRGPDKVKGQVEWAIEYTRAGSLAKRAVLVALRYTREEAGDGRYVPDYFSVAGLIGRTVVQPPTVDGLREVLGDASFRP